MTSKTSKYFGYYIHEMCLEFNIGPKKRTLYEVALMSTSYLYRSTYQKDNNFCLIFDIRVLDSTLMANVNR